MTHLCVAIFVTDEAQAKRDIALAAEAGADMVELRIDTFNGDASNLVDHSILPTITTCRPIWEGGRSTASDHSRVDTLSFLSHLSTYIDLELKTHQQLKLSGGGFS